MFDLFSANAFSLGYYKMLSFGIDLILCDTYRICHELTDEIKIILNESWKMLLSKPLASLITFF